MILGKVPESEINSSETRSNKLPTIVPFEEHQRLIEEAAKRASRETIESLRKAEIHNDRESSGDEGGEESDGEELDFFATKTNKSIKNMVSSVATLKRAFEQPPSQIESLLYNAFTQNMVSKLTGDGEKKKNWYDEILSSFAHGVGQRGPELIESLTRNFGSDWVKQTATGLLNPGAIVNTGGGGGPGGGYGGQGQGQGGQGNMQGGQGRGRGSDLNQDAVDQIMALDPNNPEHVAAYAEIQGNIDINDARKMLQIHQDIFMNKLKRNAAQTGMEIQDPRARHVEVPPVPVNPGGNSDVPPVWAQVMMNKILELEKKVNDVYVDVEADVIVPKVTIPKVSDIRMGGIGKVQTPEEFQRELEEELRRDQERLNNKVNGNVGKIGNVNKWDDDPSTDIGTISHERRLEEEQMRKKPLHDASADLIMKEVEDQREKLKVVSVTPNEYIETVDVHVDIPEDIKSDIDKIEEEIDKAENNIEDNSDSVHNKAPKSILDMKEETKDVKSYPKGSQGWLKEQQKKKVNK